MHNTERVIGRLPRHFQAYNKDSNLYKFVNAIGKNLHVTEEDINAIMMSRWFATADDVDLNKIGALFGIERLQAETFIKYKTRLYSTIQDLLVGMGTVESIRKLVRAAVGIEPEIIENPPRRASSPFQALKPGDRWKVFCDSVVEARPTIYLKGVATTRNPTLTNLTNQETVTYKGLLRKGAVLTIFSEGQASLAGIDVADKILVSSDRALWLPKATSEWLYTDSSALLGHAKFDEAALAEDGAWMVELKMEWCERRPAAFGVRLTAGVGDEQERQKIMKLVESVRTAGVVAEVEFGELLR
jgi:hypothetical protein